MVDASGVVFSPVLSGVALADQIVTSGSFLIDAETRLNPAAGSIYFGGGASGSKGSAGTTVRPTTPEDPDAKITAALAALSPADRALAEQQRTCPILPNSRLGSMGTPVKLLLEGETVFICCPGCKDQATSNPQKTVDRVKELRSQPRQSQPPKDEAPKAPPVLAQSDSAEQKITAALAQLAPADRELAASQRFCAVIEKSRLGSMGPPVRVVLNGEPVFLCCKGCEQAAKADPQGTLARAKQLRAAHQTKSSAAATTGDRR
jgi:membrane fusion protein, copper/silver efflux system